MPAVEKRFVAVTAFAVDVSGIQYVVHQGEVLAARHPAVKARPELFRNERETPARGDVR